MRYVTRSLKTLICNQLCALLENEKCCCHDNCSKCGKCNRTGATAFGSGVVGSGGIISGIISRSGILCRLFSRILTLCPVTETGNIEGNLDRSGVARLSKLEEILAVVVPLILEKNVAVFLIIGAEECFFFIPNGLAVYLNFDIGEGDACIEGNVGGNEQKAEVLLILEIGVSKRYGVGAVAVEVSIGESACIEGLCAYRPKAVKSGNAGFFMYHADAVGAVVNSVTENPKGGAGLAAEVCMIALKLFKGGCGNGHAGKHCDDHYAAKEHC